MSSDTVVSFVGRDDRQQALDGQINASGRSIQMLQSRSTVPMTGRIARHRRSTVSAKSHIVICDADTEKADNVRAYLANHGYHISSIQDGETLKRWAVSSSASAVLLDLTLPGEDALSVLRHLKERTELGILALTASNEAIDRIVAIEAGADDCLSYPFEPRELLARMRAVMRRVSKTDRVRQDVLKYMQQTVKFGDCTLDMSAGKLFAPDGGEIGVTAMEFCLLRTFAEHPNRALNRDELAELAYGKEWSPLDRSLDIRISRLRRKLERNPAKPEIITTVRGIGYRFQPAL